MLLFVYYHGHCQKWLIVDYLKEFSIERFLDSFVTQDRKGALPADYLSAVKNDRVLPVFPDMHSLQASDGGLQEPIMCSNLHDDTCQAQVPNIGVVRSAVKVAVSYLINEKATGHKQEH